MSVYMIATIETQPGGMEGLKGAIAEIIPIVEGQGWKLASAYALRTGQVGTVVDVWEMPDFNSLNVGMAAIAQHPDFPRIQKTLQQCIAKETLVLADALDYPVKR